MATWFRRTRAVARYLRRNNECRSSSSSSRGILGRQDVSVPVMQCLRSVRIGSAMGRISPTRFPIFSAKHFESTRAEKQLESLHAVGEEEKEDDGEGEGDGGGDPQVMDFPGGKVAFTSKMQFISESADKRVPCYRVLDDYGQPIAHDCFAQVNEELAVKMYTEMVTLQIMDAIFYEAQRQGRISFYVTSLGEEAINIASAAALTDDDVIFPQFSDGTVSLNSATKHRDALRFRLSIWDRVIREFFTVVSGIPTLKYREHGVLLWRGFTLQEFANQCFGNKVDYGKGRQMPIHYGSNKHNYFTVSSPIATQIPQAVGAAYSLKMDKKNACVAVYFGDGGTSEGDFHAGFNLAAVTEAPVIFICRNNGWAISTHIREQFRSDGIVVRGQAYGIRSIRVDGNDTLAIYSAVREAREMAIKDQMPILIEALTYRVGHHSTSDDSTKYRPMNEIEYWKMSRNPVNRFRKWVERNMWWDEKREVELRNNIRNQVLQAIQTAEKYEKPPLTDLFRDVYDTLPSNLHEQETQLRETIKRHPKDYPLDVPV